MTRDVGRKPRAHGLLKAKGTKCFSKGATSWVKCCCELAKDGDRELAINFGFLKVIGGLASGCPGGVVRTKSDYRRAQREWKEMNLSQVHTILYEFW